MFFHKNNRIYADFNATTPVLPEVISTLEKKLKETYANPSSLHKDGVKAKEVLEDSRLICAKSIGAHADEILFTSGGTESINLALQGAVRSDEHIVSSTIEHRATLETLNFLQTQGVRSTLVGVSGEGIVDLKEVREAINEKTKIVSCMLVNNEIGTIQPIKDIAKIIRKKQKEFGTKILFHIDASQAPMWLPINVEKLNVDLLTIDGSKVRGPKGVGLLYVKRNTALRPIVFGGGQEFGLRSGTEPVFLIAGLAKALEVAVGEINNNVSKVTVLRDLFEKEIKEKLPGNYVLGSGTERVCNTSAVCFPGIDSEFLVLQLDARGVSTSYGSACSSDKHVAGSHVIKSMCLDECANSMIRFSFGPQNTKREIEEIVSILLQIISN